MRNLSLVNETLRPETETFDDNEMFPHFTKTKTLGKCISRMRSRD